jgi:hypothetical protein
MKTAKWLTCVAIVGWLTGCASVDMKVDSGPIPARTFSFVIPSPRSEANLRPNEIKVHELIQEALTANLGAKGVSRVEAGGEVVVAYLIVVGTGTVTTCRDEYFGFDSEATELLNEVHARSVKKSGRNYMVAGTLVIDLLDGKTSRLLKRATVESEVLRNLSDDVRAARIQSVVDQALSDLRIAP